MKQGNAPPNPEMLAAARALLISAARDRRFVTYTWLAERLQPQQKRVVAKNLGRHLYYVSVAENSVGRPLVSAICINGKTGRPGRGFASCAADCGRKGDSERVWSASTRRLASGGSASSSTTTCSPTGRHSTRSHGR